MTLIRQAYVDGLIKNAVRGDKAQGSHDVMQLLEEAHACLQRASVCVLTIADPNREMRMTHGVAELLQSHVENELRLLKDQKTHA